VVAVEGFGERVRVQLEGPVPLVAEVTTSAVAELDLRPGARAWTSVKATEVAAYPR
jgi:molybdate transport system ATP-binding protein